MSLGFLTSVVLKQKFKIISFNQRLYMKLKSAQCCWNIRWSSVLPTLRDLWCCAVYNSRLLVRKVDCTQLTYWHSFQLPTSCWVTGCDNRDKKISFVSFHRFPDGKQEPNRRKQWIEFCERNISAEPSWTDGICSEHFDVKSFSKRTKSLTGDGRIWLFINAVPNLSPPSTLVEKREERQKG